jgi:membrane protease YdiL (CAAX protease family)
MSLLKECVKLAVYLICIGFTLEFSHRLYWYANKNTHNLHCTIFRRSLHAILASYIPLVCTIGTTIFFVKFVDFQQLSVLGIHCDNRSISQIGYGLAVALFCVICTFFLCNLFGYIKISKSRLLQEQTCLPLFLGESTYFFAASVFEELIFRGYVFYVLLTAFGSSIAIIGSAGLFSLAHLIKHRKIPTLYILNGFIFGLLVALCREITGSLWLPIGLHFGWNIVSGPILGLPFAGVDFERGIVRSEVSGPMWLTGGRYSLDAGIMGTLTLLAAAAGLSIIVPIL